MDYNELITRASRELARFTARPPDLVVQIHPDDYTDVLRTWPTDINPPGFEGKPRIGPLEVFVDPMTPVGHPVLRSAWSVAL